MTGQDAPPPEAVLIRRARLASKLSPEQAAPLTGVIGARRWRQIEAGYAGKRRSVAEDDILSHMAAVVGVTAEQLAEAGRAEAAEILREIQRRRAASTERERELPEVDPRERRIILAVLHELRATQSDGERRGA